MNFVAFDVETANRKRESICRIGAARYENGVLQGEWASYVDPKDDFDPRYVEIHGIVESDVKGKPMFPELRGKLRKYLDGNVVVHHRPFDRQAIKGACEKYDLDVPQCTWLDSAEVVRRAWPERSEKGYGLGEVCGMLGYEFKHHDPLEDAKAAAYVFIAASRKMELDIEGWLDRLKEPTSSSSNRSSPSKKRERNPNPKGALYEHGEVIVFTGTLTRLRRDDAEYQALDIGCRVAGSVTKKTTKLVVGDQDAKTKKSRKYKEAEKRQEQGHPIKIMTESDFEELVEKYSARDR